MKWTEEDVIMYQKAKEYIDTAVIPLLPVSFSGDMNQSAASNDYLTVLTHELEKQYKGRILLLPPVIYPADTKEAAGLVKPWTELLNNQGFAHRFLLTSDIMWKRHEQSLDADLLWMPSLPIASMERGQARQMIADQVRQLAELFTLAWEKDLSE